MGMNFNSFDEGVYKRWVRSLMIQYVEHRGLKGNNKLLEYVSMYNRLRITK